MREELYRQKHWSSRNKTLYMEKGEENIYIPTPLPEKDLVPGIYWGEGLQALKKLGDESVQAIFADPPYFGKQKAFGRSIPNLWEEYYTWSIAWIKEAYRVLKDTGSIYVCCDWSYSGKVQEILEEAGFHIQNRITWKREKGRGALRNWKNNMEDIWFAVKDEKNFYFDVESVKIKKKVIAPYRDTSGKPKDWLEEDGNRYRLTYPSNIWLDITVPFWSMPENTPHPTQKPEKLVDRCLRPVVQKGDLILDPFLGSGTTAVIADRLEAEFIGIELDPDYVRLAMKRFALRHELAANTNTDYEMELDLE